MLLDNLVGAHQDRIRNGQAECPGRLEIEHKFEPGGLLRRQVSRLFTPENPGDINAELAAMAWAHISKLDSIQRRRLLILLAQTRGRPGSLGKGEREELAFLLAILEPRLFLGSAAKRLSPVPMPKRLLYGPRSSSARAAAAQRR